MKYRSELFLALASAALLAACGGADTEEVEVSEPPADETLLPQEEEMPDVVTEPMPEVSEEPASSAQTPTPDAPPPSARLDSHVHGHGTLVVTAQNGMIGVSLEAPLSAFGLTEDPQTEEDRAAIEAVRNDLTNNANLITFSGGVSCDISSKSMATRLASGHGELQMDYSFVCQNAEALSAVRFGGFGMYPALSEIDAVYVSDTKQTTAELTPASPELRIN